MQTVRRSTSRDGSCTPTQLRVPTDHFFVPLTRPGCACLSRNREIAHGRTAFIDGDCLDQHRLLSRKWFMASEAHSTYQHVPGIALRRDAAELLPDQFGPDQSLGKWLYDQSPDLNLKLK